MSRFEIRDGVLVKYNAPSLLKEKEDYTLVILYSYTKIPEEYILEKSDGWTVKLC